MVLAPYTQSSGNRVPYVTAAEVLNNAVANNIDFSNLIVGGDDDQQAAALQQLISEASTKVDVTCLGWDGTLCATLNTENLHGVIPNRSGYLSIHPKFWPILELQTFAVGFGPGAGMQDIDLTDDNCSIEETQFVITTQAANGSVSGVSLNAVIGGGWGTRAPQFCQWTYVNGFPNTFLADSVDAAATEIVVLPSPGSASPCGIYPGRPLTIYDTVNTEGVLVDESYDMVSTTIPLANPLMYAHDAGVNVSRIPDTIKLAVVHFICDLAISRGQGGIVLEDMGQIAEGGSGGGRAAGDGINHEAHAYDLLDEFKQYYGLAG
jgi:hypothetical protein